MNRKITKCSRRE